jgi:acetamidase/formamidase
MNTLLPQPRRSPRSRRVSLIGRLLAIALAPTCALALEVPFDYHVPCTPENAIFGYFSKDKKPVLTVKSGAVVKIDGGGGNKWGDETDPNVWLKKHNIPITVESSPALTEIVTAIKESPNRLPPPPGSAPGTRTGGHFLIGPIYIEEAEPGDSLEVRILDVTPRLPYGANGARPGGGGLPDLIPRPFEQIYLIDTKRNAAVVSDKIEVPLAPFNGVNGVCPPDSEGPNRRSGPPGLFAGNLDSKDLITGSTLYIPIFQKGALFYTGDCHAAQGDGEVAGDAIGTANTVTYQFILHKGKTLKGPRAENATHYITYGLDPDLDKAMRMALIEALDFLKEKEGMDFLPAYALASASIDFRVTQIVDKTLGVHGMIPKSIFIKDTSSTYWYRTPRF